MSLKNYNNVAKLMSEVDVLNAKIDDNIDVLEDKYLGNKEDIVDFKETLLVWRQKRHAIIEAFSKGQWDLAFKIAQRDGYAVNEFADMTLQLNNIVNVSKAKASEYATEAEKSNKHFEHISAYYIYGLLFWIVLAAIIIGLPIFKHEKILRKDATRDFLTGTFNRREFTRQYELNSLISSGDASVGLIMFDLDHFKNVNDTYGHIAGDVVLKSVANNIKSVLRENDVFGRLGGEEFAILIFNSPRDALYDIAEKVRFIIESKLIQLADGKQIKVTASFGLAYSKLDESTFENLYTRADAALYVSKNAGRNCITFDE